MIVPVANKGKAALIDMHRFNSLSSSDNILIRWK